MDRRTLRERLKYHLIPPSWHARDVRRRLRRLEPEFDLLPFLVSRERTAVDIGANKGGYTRELLKFAAAVHAFEPRPALLPWLQRIRSSRLTVHSFAVGSYDGDATLHVPINKRGVTSNQLASLTPPREGGEHLKLSCPVRRMDSLDLGDVGFIKIDVEGHESQVIEGASELIARSRPVMLIEIEEAHAGEPVRGIIDKIERHGYRSVALVDSVLTDARQVENPSAAHVFNYIFLPLI